jgi:hypothetical protein
LNRETDRLKRDSVGNKLKKEEKKKREKSGVMINVKLNERRNKKGS